MQSWNVNWGIKQFKMQFDQDELIFICLNCDPTILHEYIGGYIYLSLRETSSTDNSNIFYKLTEKQDSDKI
jgi:hypothetical protein